MKRLTKGNRQYELIETLLGQSSSRDICTIYVYAASDSSWDKLYLINYRDQWLLSYLPRTATDLAFRLMADLPIPAMYRVTRREGEFLANGIPIIWTLEET